MPNNLRTDPTRTGMLRRAMMAEMVRRFAAVYKEIYKFVVTDDTFALEELPEKKALRKQGLHILQRQRYLFMTNPQKIESFEKWLTNVVDANILAIEPGTGDPWTSRYIYNGYRQGVTRAYSDTNKASLAVTPDYYAGSRDQFLRSAFGQPEILQKLKILGTRAFNQLKGITAQMSQEISRVLVEGMAAGQNPLKIARGMKRVVNKISRIRARRIARTEIIYAHAEGQLDAFDMLGVDEVGVMAEWSTAGDDFVCVHCLDMEGKRFKVEDAHNEIPLHPNCRCAWIPYIPPKKKRPLRQRVSAVSFG